MTQPTQAQIEATTITPDWIALMVAARSLLEECKHGDLAPSLGALARLEDAMHTLWKNYGTEQSTRDCGNTAGLQSAAVSPTQAQIEAAARILTRYIAQCTDAAREALTAAAEVGKPKGMLNETEIWINKIQETEAATIERCAQVADGFAELSAKEAILNMAEKIAAAIRALKDEP